MSPQVAVIFRRFGPYHRARLAFTAKLGEVTGIEASDVDSTYGWEPSSGETPGLLTVLPGLKLEEASRRHLVKELGAILWKVAPGCVAIPGWSDPVAIGALSWCLRAGVPAVLMADSAEADAPRTRPAEWIKSRIVRLFQAALVAGGRHRAYVEALGIERGLIWDGYDVVDNTYFSDRAAQSRACAKMERARLNLPPRYWFASCRFIPKKNLGMLLDGYAEYRRAKGPAAWSLVLAGDGRLRETLQMQIRTLGLDAHVILPGFVQYRDLPSYYALAEALVHASTVEQWGLVVNEAMASGLPVLASSRCGCVPDLVRDGDNGFTFDPSDVQQLANLMLRMHAMGPRLAALGARSQAIILDWGPERFARNLWAAVHAATARPVRRRGLVDRAILYAALYA